MPGSWRSIAPKLRSISAKLRPVGIQIRRALLLVFELAAQIHLIRFGLLQHRPVFVPHQQVPGETGAHDEYQCDEEAANGQRPASGVAWIERAQLI